MSLRSAPFLASHAQTASEVLFHLIPSLIHPLFPPCLIKTALLFSHLSHVWKQFDTLDGHPDMTKGFGSLSEL